MYVCPVFTCSLISNRSSLQIIPCCKTYLEMQRPVFFCEVISVSLTKMYLTRQTSVYIAMEIGLFSISASSLLTVNDVYMYYHSRVLANWSLLITRRFMALIQLVLCLGKADYRTDTGMTMSPYHIEGPYPVAMSTAKRWCNVVINRYTVARTPNFSRQTLNAKR